MNKVIVATGATSGYGLEAARKFAQQGEKVIVVARNKDNIEKTKQELGVDGFSADITKRGDWAALYKYVKDKYGRIDLLLNNAGGGVAMGPFLEQTPEQIEYSIAYNLTGAMWGCQTFAPMMVEQKGGTIINIASVCATRAWTNLSVYSAAKAGLRMFSKTLYVELSPKNIRVSCLIPAAGETHFFENCGLEHSAPGMKAADFAQSIVDTFNLPDHIVVEEATVWGIDQYIMPL